jgi:hypothetical protein
MATTDLARQRPTSHGNDRPRTATIDLADPSLRLSVEDRDRHLVPHAWPVPVDGAPGLPDVEAQ